jgi:hypothetical protein
MCRHDGSEPKGLRRLHPNKSFTIDYIAQCPARAGERIDNREGGDCTFRTLQCINQAVDYDCAKERTRRVVDQNDGSTGHSDCLQTGSNRILSLRTTGDETGNRTPGKRGLGQGALTLADHHMHRSNGRMPEKGIDRMCEERLSPQRRELLRKPATHAFAFSGSDDQGGYGHAGAHNPRIHFAEGVLRRSMKLRRELP